MGKLLPRSRFPVGRNVAPPPPPADKGKGDSLTAERSHAVAQQRRGNSAKRADGDAGDAPSTAAAYGAPASTGPEAGSPATAGGLFVFRDPPQSRDLAGPPRRKKKRSFLNLKKNTVAPTDLP